MSGVLRALGLCRRAGALICGTPMICGELPKGKLLLVVEACDTSDGTHKKITDKCGYYDVEHIRIGADGVSLAAAVGKSGSLAAVATGDENLAGLIRSAIDKERTDS